MKLVTRSTRAIGLQFLFWWSIPFALTYDIPLCLESNICLAQDPVLYLLATALLPLFVLVFSNVLHARTSIVKSFCYAAAAALLKDALVTPQVEDSTTLFATLLFALTCTTFFGRDTLHNRNVPSQTILFLFFMLPWLGLRLGMTEIWLGNPVGLAPYCIMLGLLSSLIIAVLYVVLYTRGNTTRARSS